MSDTFTSSNALTKPGIGTDSGGLWGTLLNGDMDLIDTAIDGVESIVLTTTTLTLNIANGTASNGRYKLIIFSGSPSASVSVSITPINIQKIYKIVNNSSKSVVLSNGTGDSAIVTSGSSEDVYCDGNGNVYGYNSGTSSTFAGITVSGTATFNGNTVVNGAATFNSVPNFPNGLDVTNFINSGYQTQNGIATFNNTVNLTTATNVGSQTLAQYIQSNAIPNFAASPGSGGAFYIMYFAGSVGARTAIMVGSGVLANGATIVVPSGFNSSQTAFSASVNTINTGNTSQPLSLINCSVSSGGVITCTASDNNSHNFTGTANWVAMSVTTTF
jgi:hypothetical protein